MRVNPFRCAAIAIAAFLAFSSAASANTIKVYSLNGSQPGIVHDPDKPAPTVTAEGFYAQGTTGQYNSVRFTPAALGMAGLTLGDILSVSYDHKQAGGGLDWQFKVYTESSPTTGNGWYGYRLNYDLSSGNVDGTWSTFTDTNAGAERIKPFNSADIYRASNPVSFANALAAASSQKVMFFDISAGANSGGFPYNTFLNNITVNAGNGYGSTTLQAAVVPLPAALPAGLALLGAFGLKRKFGKRKTA